MKKILFLLLLQTYITTISSHPLTNAKQKIQELLEQVTSLKKDLEEEEEENNFIIKSKSKPKQSSSTKGLPAGWTRATLIVRESHLKKLKAVSYWDRVTIKYLVDQALENFLSNKKVKSLNIKSD